MGQMWIFVFYLDILHHFFEFQMIYDRKFCFGVNGAMDKSESVFTGI